MILKFKGETFYIRVNGKLIRLEAGADVEVEFPDLDQREWLEGELKRVKREKK